MQPQDLSPWLFWDTDRSRVDLTLHRSYVIERVLEYGLWEDWKKIRQHYGDQTILETALNARSLSGKSRAFICSVYGGSPDQFRCYTLQQSNPIHWNDQEYLFQKTEGMRTVVLRLPDSVELTDFDITMILATRLYEEGRLSAGQAAELAGITKRSFIELLGTYKVSAFSTSAEDLRSDINND